MPHRPTKWERDVKKGLSKLEGVKKVSIDYQSGKHHKAIIITKTNNTFTYTFSKTLSCRRGLQNLISDVKRKTAND